MPITHMMLMMMTPEHPNSRWEQSMRQLRPTLWVLVVTAVMPLLLLALPAR